MARDTITPFIENPNGAFGYDSFTYPEFDPDDRSMTFAAPDYQSGVIEIAVQTQQGPSGVIAPAVDFKIGLGDGDPQLRKNATLDYSTGLYVRQTATEMASLLDFGQGGQGLYIAASGVHPTDSTTTTSDVAATLDTQVVNVVDASTFTAGKLAIFAYQSSTLEMVALVLEKTATSLTITPAYGSTSFNEAGIAKFIPSGTTVRPGQLEISGAQYGWKEVERHLYRTTRNANIASVYFLNSLFVESASGQTGGPNVTGSLGRVITVSAESGDVRFEGVRRTSTTATTGDVRYDMAFNGVVGGSGDTIGYLRWRAFGQPDQGRLEIALKKTGQVIANMAIFDTDPSAAGKISFPVDTIDLSSMASITNALDVGGRDFTIRRADAISTAATDPGFSVGVTGEAHQRGLWRKDGLIELGAGSSARDWGITRIAQDVGGTLAGDKFIAQGGLGVGNFQAATTYSGFAGVSQVYSSNGSALGYALVFSTFA